MKRSGPPVPCWSRAAIASTPGRRFHTALRSSTLAQGSQQRILSTCGTRLRATPSQRLNHLNRVHRFFNDPATGEPGRLDALYERLVKSVFLVLEGGDKVGKAASGGRTLDLCFTKASLYH